MAVDEQGVIVKAVQNYTYPEGSSIHGLAFHPSGKYLYSSDMPGNRIWTHQIDPESGKVTYLAESTIDGEPRHVFVHPNGNFAFSMLEDKNEVAECTIDGSTGILKFSGRRFSIIPPGECLTRH